MLEEDDASEENIEAALEKGTVDDVEKYVHLNGDLFSPVQAL
jgi:hypothetical protein